MELDHPAGDTACCVTDARWLEDRVESRLRLAARGELYGGEDIVVEWYRAKLHWLHAIVSFLELARTL